MAANRSLHAAHILIRAASRLLPALILLQLIAASLFGQGFGYGTAVVVLRSPDVLLAAVDSKEIYRDYRDGKAIVDERTACKLTEAGPYYAIISGLSHGTNGFDALHEATQSYQAGDSLGQIAARTESSVPRLLIPLLKSIRDRDPADFAQRYRSQPVLQLTLLGRDKGSPRVIVLEFIERESLAGSLDLATHTTSCPGDCPSPTSAYFLGAHEKIDEVVGRNMSLIRRPDESRVEKLMNFEYVDRPDVVGGPISMVKIAKSGGTILHAGVCSLH